MKKMELNGVLLALFGLSLSISISAAYLFLGIFLVRWAWLFFKKRDFFRWQTTSLDPWLPVFYLWGIGVTLISSPSTIQKSFSTYNSFILFFLFCHGLKTEEPEKIFKWFCLGSALMGLLGVLQIAGQINYLPMENITQAPNRFAEWPEGLKQFFSMRNSRAVGSRSHPLTYAECLFPAFFLLMWFCHKASSFKSKALIGAGLTFVLSGIVLASGRGIWLGVFGGSLILAVFLPKGSFLKKAVAAAVIVAPLFLIFSPTLRGRTFSIFSGHHGTLGDQQSKSTRLQLWDKTFEKIRERPLTGSGLGGVRLVAMDPVEQKNRIWTETHNMYLQIVAESGLIGLAIFFGILFLIIREIFGLDPVPRSVFGAILFGFLLAGLTESWMRDKEVAMVFWALIGWIFHEKKA